MVQKIGAQYLAKKIADQVLNPTPAAQPSGEQPPVAQASSITSSPASHAGPDVIVVKDENGRSLGSAYRVSEVAVYVVASPQAGRAQELEHGLTDPDTQIQPYFENGRLVGIIYIPARSRTLGNLHGGRADDV